MPIGVNIAKARDLQKERFRQVRKPLLDALDIEYQRADEAGDASKKTEVATKKQALRDVTNNSTLNACLLYTSPSPRDGLLSRMPSSA